MDRIFEDVVRDPYSYAKDWKARTGNRVVGYFCSYAPEEIIHAAGALPFRIFGTGKHVTLADAHSACLVADTYTSAWSGVAHLLDENNFLESAAIAYSSTYINISIDKMLGTIRKMISKYNIDGLVIHSNRSCKSYSLGQYDLQRMVMKEFGVPSLIIEADMVDERNFSESQIETRIDAFMETLAHKKS